MGGSCYEPTGRWSNYLAQRWQLESRTRTRLLIKVRSVWREIECEIAYYEGGDPDLRLVALSGEREGEGRSDQDTLTDVHRSSDHHIGSVRRVRSRFAAPGGEGEQWTTIGAVGGQVYGTREEAAASLARDYLQRVAVEIDRMSARGYERN